MAGSSRSGLPRRSSREREQKKQSRLLFSPLPSSSPSKQQYSKAVQNRLAAVTFEGARDSPDPISLLSPEPSSALEATIDAPTEMSARHILPSSPTRARVQRIQLSDESDEDDLVVPAGKRQKVSSPSQHIPTPISGSRRSRRLHHGSSSYSKDRVATSDEDEIEELPSSPARRRSGRLQQKSSPSHLTEQDTAPAKSSSAIGFTTLSDLGSPETSDDDDIVLVTKPAMRRKSRLDKDEVFVVNNDELEFLQDERPATRMTPRRKQSRPDNFIVDDDEVEYLSSEADNDTSEAQGSRYAWRQSSHKEMPAKHISRSRKEQAELEDDLQDLQDSDVETPGTKLRRTRGGPVTTQKDQTREHFQLLKRRRAGEKITRVADSDDESDGEVQGADINLIGAPDHGVSADEYISSDSDSDAQNEEAAQEEDEDDFIEEDAEGRLGRPNSDMPLEFTSFASRKPKELFIHIVEWMVKNKIAPAFNREDPVYQLALARVDDQVKAQAGSRLISSAWGNNFKHTILARPSMKVVALPGLDEDHMRTCDACNRTNNPARYEFVFSGEPYYTQTLEPVDNSEDDEVEDDADVTYDEAGHLIASHDTRFYLGRFCAANAEMGHKLTHWKYHLNEKLMTYLESQHVLAADAIVAREKMNKKKREKQAETIVDDMEETGVIDDFWNDFQNDLNDARLGMVDYEKKGGRTKGRVGAIRTTNRGLVREWDKDKYKVNYAVESDSDEF